MDCFLILFRADAAEKFGILKSFVGRIVLGHNVNVGIFGDLLS